jgi:hypothetical protein
VNPPLAKGATVRQKVEVISGPVLDVKFDADSGTFEYLVQYEQDGHTSSRWFGAGDVEQIAPAPSADTAPINAESAAATQIIGAADVGDASVLIK